MDNSVKSIWWRFHKKNPRVYELFKQFTFRAIDSGKRKLSAVWVMNRIRWEVEIETKGDPFKVNNNFICYYARLFHHDYPNHKVFEMRKLKR